MAKKTSILSLSRRLKDKWGKRNAKGMDKAHQAAERAGSIHQAHVRGGKKAATTRDEHKLQKALGKMEKKHRSKSKIQTGPKGGKFVISAKGKKYYLGKKTKTSRKKK